MRESFELGEIDRTVIDRCRIEFEISGVDDEARRRRDCESDRVRDAVRHAKWFDPECTGAVGGVRVRIEFAQIGLMQIARFLELDLDQAERKPCSVDRHPELRQEVRDRADVVFVPVSEEQAPDLVATFFQVGDVRQDQIDPRLLLFGKTDAAVDHNDVFARFEQKHVLADFADTAEENESY